MVASIVCLIHIFYNLAIYSQKKRFPVDLELFDKSTVTVGDYSVELDINDD
jgi:outer membrane usher protein FimD/PapC